MFSVLYPCRFSLPYLTVPGMCRRVAVPSAWVLVVALHKRTSGRSFAYHCISAKTATGDATKDSHATGPNPCAKRQNDVWIGGWPPFWSLGTEERTAHRSDAPSRES